MEKDRTQKYAEGLEKTIQTDYAYLKEMIEDFQNICLRITPDKNVPPGMITNIRKANKEIQDKLKEIRAIQQLLQGKYRKYYRRDTHRDKEIFELEFIAKSCISKFEFVLMEKEAKRKLKEGEPAGSIPPLVKPFQWFQTKENQETFLKIVGTLYSLNYEAVPQLVIQDRRQIDKNIIRSLTLFLFSGDSGSLDDLQSQIRLRKHDIIERHNEDELRGVLTHLKEVHPLEVEKVFRRFLGRRVFSHIKCLLLQIKSPKNLETDLLDLIQKTLKEMKEGEVKTLSI